MQGICKGEIRAKESRSADSGAMGCIKCGWLLDFLRGKKMGIQSGFTLWNLVFCLMVSSVKGRLLPLPPFDLGVPLDRGVRSPPRPLPRSYRKCICLLGRVGIDCSIDCMAPS
uniref:Uncharacterized protein n=1 Tax=Sphenodon punctatus TaxID=8508 RepID=A0A8D0H0K8_SPHPU